MKKLILTSSGFDNKNVEELFKKMICKEIHNLKVLFIPRAALQSNNQEYIELCRAELINAGVLENNITRNDLDNEISKDEIANYDVIYMTGGVTKHLVEHMEKYNFKESLDCFFDKDGIYVGVSAGSIALSMHQSEKIGLLKSKLKVHSKVGTANGEFIDDFNNEIELTDNQAIIIVGDSYSISE